jgi:hypothetical protein
MDKDFTSLENAWKKSKKSIQDSEKNVEAIYKKIDQAKGDNVKFYYGTLFILLFTLIGITSFFVFVAPVKELLSRIGASAMIIGLVVRILIEVRSISKLKNIQVDHSTLETIESAIDFHKHRKVIHSIIMPVILVIYSIGFYMLTPEFLKYLSVEMVIFYDVIYLVMILFLFFQFRKGIKKEMTNLELTIDLKKSVVED